MSRISQFIVVIGLIAAVLLVCIEGKHWPDFSCHPFKASGTQKGKVNHYEMGWESCIDSFQNNKGRCPNICLLVKRAILVRTIKDGPFTLSGDAFIKLLVEELGIDMDNPSVSEKKIMDQVRSDLDQCRINHPEHATLQTRGATCEPWLNVTQCIGKASGCGGT